MNNKILYELFVLGFALVFVGAFSYDFSKPVSGLGITGLAVGNVGPDGGLDDANCDSIIGWAKDPDTPDTAINVHIYRDGPAGSGTLVGGFPAATSRVDIGAHGFNIPTPSSLKDLPREIYVHGIDSSGNGNNPVIGHKKMPSCGTCSVKFTSNIPAQFTVLRTDGSITHNDRGVNSAGATTTLTLPSGKWDMRLKAGSFSSDYELSSTNPVTPRGAQDCPVNGEVLWRWNFVRKSGTPPALPGTTHELQLKAGWNLVSTHVKQATAAAFTSFSHNCNFLIPQGFQKHLLKYSNANNRYEDANSITNSREGFWVGVDSDCSVRIRGDDSHTIASYFTQGPDLRRGWNFVGGIPESKPFNDIKGTCTFALGPFWWNPAQEAWETPANMESGKGYIIGVNSNCRLAAATTSTNPPILPLIEGAGNSCGISGSITCNGQSSCNFNSGQTIRIAWSSSGADSCTVNPAGWSTTSGSYGTTPGNTQTFTLRCTKGSNTCNVASVTATLQSGGTTTGTGSSSTCNNDREESGEECDRGTRNGPCPAECSAQCRWNRC